MSHFAPAWLAASRSSNKGDSTLKKLFQKIAAAKSDPHTDRLKAIIKLDGDLDSAVSAALAAGVTPDVIIASLERQENGARARLVAALRF